MNKSKSGWWKQHNFALMCSPMLGSRHGKSIGEYATYMCLWLHVARGCLGAELYVYMNKNVWLHVYILYKRTCMCDLYECIWAWCDLSRIVQRQVSRSLSVVYHISHMSCHSLVSLVNFNLSDDICLKCFFHLNFCASPRAHISSRMLKCACISMNIWYICVYVYVYIYIYNQIAR